MPKGKWETPETGNAPAAVVNIVAAVYRSCRDKQWDEHGNSVNENADMKASCAKQAWSAVANAGWKKDAKDEWHHFKESDQRVTLPNGSQDQDLTLHETLAVGSPTNAEGSIWQVSLFDFGKSKRPPHFVYTRETAENSKEALTNVRVYALTQTDDHGHTSAAKKSTKDIIGTIPAVNFTETGVVGDLHLLPSADWLRQNLLHIHTNKLPMPYELSIDASGKAAMGEYQGERLPIARRFDRVTLDVVERGAAGGRVLKMVASLTHSQGDTMNPIKQKLLLLFTLLYPSFLESKKVDVTAIAENELFTHLLEADKAQPRMHLPDGAQLSESLLDESLKKIRDAFTKTDDQFLASLTAKIDKLLPSDNKLVDKAKAEFTESMKSMQTQMDALKRTNCEAILTATLRESLLPQAIVDDLRAQFTETVEGKATTKLFEKAELDAAIKRTKETYAKFTASISGVNMIGLDVKAGENARDKMEKALLAFFMETNPLYPLKAEERKAMGIETAGRGFKSFREAYVNFTGDTEVSFRVDRMRFTESLDTTSWPNALASSMNRRMVRDYNMMGLDTWRPLVDVVPLKDFRQQERIRTGGYPNLPVRAQGNPYLPLASPTDEKATYTPTTKGGTEDITRETIINDDISAVSRIPTRMARAAAQTLHQFVFDFICPAVNPTIYDSVALYHSNHLNTATTALGTDGAAFKAARLRMKKFPQKDNAKRLGIRAGWLIVPSDLEADAYINVTPAAGNQNAVPKFEQQLGVGVIVVDYWTDATDWVLAARREDVVGLEIGFLNGQEIPEMFISNLENVGAWFTNDKLIWKIRHEYGGAVVDWRAFDGSIVA